MYVCKDRGLANRMLKICKYKVDIFPRGWFVFTTFVLMINSPAVERLIGYNVYSVIQIGTLQDPEPLHFFLKNTVHKAPIFT